MHHLENDKLKIAVKPTGAELCGIRSIKRKTDFMWDANPNVWGSYAPNLFPIVGGLKDNTYQFEGKTYQLPRHGFFRHSEAIKLLGETENSLTFGLTYNEDTLKVYPFKFEFQITFTLKDNTVKLLHIIKNLDDQPLYFSMGGHPAFKCPVFQNEDYEDYYLEFEHSETSKIHLLNSAGLFSSETRPMLENTKKIPLSHNLFNDDALIFKDLKSKKVALKSQNQGEILSVSYHDFDYLGIWAKPNGDYVCIEPWLGIADSENTDQNFTTKEGILQLNANDTFRATYHIEINEALLV
ncbi:aldose 1-epimerase family protein [Hyunsoonleella sp. SJ7]|uniref:Aldose 1-epimerase family protein n=1 Tax=Hyunsoonleella aquatilis TaxID=2762758 RepID=A0A923HCA5_9FLAO|nr:aldose 1-epimerase family protein [Hyunsoonleella aquatilis]MBC3759949.1 aldose 1-epimerase family protein [Hyunsoonleella aquatilis]